MTELEQRLATGRDEDGLNRLHGELVRRAAAAELLDVAYRVIDTPVGELLVAATPDGLIRVAFAHEGHEAVLGDLSARVSPRILAAPAQLDDVARQFDDYFAGRLRRFDLPVDLRLRRGFRRRVLESLREVPYGRTVSYGSLAGEIGNPTATRAVGTACATNPLPVVIPCHRVVRADGALGGYRGGPAAKALLLRLEANAAA